MAALALVTGSCAKNESGSEGTPGTVVFKIMTDDANATRGGNIYGAEAQSNVADVLIFAFKESATPGEFLYDQTIALDDAWTLGGVSGTATVAGATLDGNYKFMAVGLESDGTTIYNALAPVQDVDNFDTFLAELTGGPETTTPIYSGVTDAMLLTAEQYAQVTITIKRAVSGIMIYLKNIPITLEGQTPASLRLTTTSDLNTNVNLSSGLGGELGDETLATPLTLINIPLINPDIEYGIFGSNAVPGTVVALPNSQLGGTFILPTATGEGINLTIGLYDTDDVMIQEFPINGGDEISLTRNVLYSLGTKYLSTSLYGSDDTPDGETDPTDSTKDDEALDIMSDQLILVEVEGAWDLVTNLEL